MRRLADVMPIAGQLQAYSYAKLSSDVVAACVVTIMLIPQSLAYAMLAGLPPQYGLYASVVPIVVYALFGSSTSLAVGPVAIASIMTASALASVTAEGIISYAEGAAVLALLSGVFMLLLGVLKFGFIANFLSHSVVSGFITASGLLIALSQLKHILGISVTGHSFFSLAAATWSALADTHLITLWIGLGSLVFLFLARARAKRLLVLLGVEADLAGTLARIAPVLGVVLTTSIVAAFNLDQQGVNIVGDIPSGIAGLGLPSLNLEALRALLAPAIFISIIGYVESISVGRTLAAKRREKIAPNQELLGLGGANIASGLFGAFPVTGGFARSVVNFDAGARTQLAGIFTAIGIALASYFLTPYLYYLPIAMLAATIIVAVLSLVDFGVIGHAWALSKSDFIAVVLTILLTLALGVEAGVASGIVASILLHLYHTSRPHIAVLGRLPDSEHFRNIKHYRVETHPSIVMLRVDESLLFSNASYLEDKIDNLVWGRAEVRHVVIHCGAVNTIDLTAMEMLESVMQKLHAQGIRLHLAEVKIPVKLQLERAHILEHLSGNLFLSLFAAYQSLTTSNSITSGAEQ